jgi:hypothetical protein
MPVQDRYPKYLSVAITKYVDNPCAILEKKGSYGKLGEKALETSHG